MKALCVVEVMVRTPQEPEEQILMSIEWTIAVPPQAVGMGHEGRAEG